MMGVQQSKLLKRAITLLLAALPSLYLLLKYPPFFNGTDALCYFDFFGSLPHYPLFYPLYCFLSLKLFGGGIASIYAIVVLQHVFYSLSVLYVAGYFSEFKRRVLFLICMFFAFRATLFIQGVFTEAWAIIAAEFVIGALLRICFMPKQAVSKFHYGVYALANVLLLLTRHAGIFLIFVLPLFALLKSIGEKKIFSRYGFNMLLKQFLFSLGLVLVAQMLTASVLIYMHAPYFSDYGIMGVCRISDAMNPEYANINPVEVCRRYKRATDDTVVKCAFDIIETSNYYGLWESAYEPLDSLKKEFIKKGIIGAAGSTHNYLNAAYRIYITTPSCYPYRRILPDVYDYFFNTDLQTEVINDCNYLVTTKAPARPTTLPRLNEYLDHEVHIADYNKAFSDILIYSTGYLNTPVLMLLIFLMKRRCTIPADTWMLFIAVFVVVCLYYILSALITVKLMRYVQPGEFMAYTMACAVVATAWPFGLWQHKQR